MWEKKPDILLDDILVGMDNETSITVIFHRYRKVEECLNLEDVKKIHTELPEMQITMSEIKWP